MIDARCQCPNCKSELRVPDLENQKAVRCACGWETAVSPDALDAGMLKRCPLCGTEDIYVQKDFPERIGVAIVVAAIVLATIAWANYSPLLTFGVLFGFGLIDWILFRTRPEVSICYRCLAQFRGVRESPVHKAFDLGINERYRQERMRKEELRARSAGLSDRSSMQSANGSTGPGTSQD